MSPIDALRMIATFPITDAAGNMDAVNMRKMAEDALASVTPPSADGWMQDGDLLYRLSDSREPNNCDEIRITQVNGSRRIADREQAIVELRSALVDAERWRAFLACGRIRLIGTAGVNYSGIHDPARLDTYGKPYGNHVHFGAEFWSTFKDQEWLAKNEPQDRGRATLTEFADACRAAQRAAS